MLKSDSDVVLSVYDPEDNLKNRFHFYCVQAPLGSINAESCISNKIN